MRQYPLQRMSTPAHVPKPHSVVPTSGYVLIVDGQAKADFKTHNEALNAARDLKGHFPMLQVKVYDADKKLSENIGLIAA